MPKEAHSKLPQQVNVRAEHGVQIEWDTNRNVQYLHVDGYTVARVNGSPRTTVIRNGDEIDLADLIDIKKAAGVIAGMLLTGEWIRNGAVGTLKLHGPEADRLEAQAIEKLRGL